MNLLSLNCRGLRNLRIVRDLCRSVNIKKHSLVFLMETKLHKKRMESVRIKTRFQKLVGGGEFG